VQRLVTGHSRPAAGHEQFETIVETRGDFLHRQHLRPGRRELYGQRDAVEPVAHPRYGRSVSLRKREGRADRGRPLDKEACRPVQGHAPDVRQAPEIWQGERGYGPGDLADDAQGLAAGCQNAQPGTGTQQRLGDSGASPHEVLAVVQDQQHPPDPDVFRQGVVHRTARTPADA
jgi:hypothetical protein